MMLEGSVQCTYAPWIALLVLTDCPEGGGFFLNSATYEYKRLAAGQVSFGSAIFVCVIVIVVTVTCAIVWLLCADICMFTFNI